MQGHDAFYPVRITSRKVAKRRSRRMSWFVVGTSFGIVSSFMISSGLTPASWNSASSVQPAPVTNGIDVVAIALPGKRPVAQAEAKAEAPTYPLALNLRAEDGDTLISILTDTGVSYDEAQRAIDSIGAVYNPKKLDIGQTISVVLAENPKALGTPVISSLKLATSPVAMLEVTRKNASVDADFDVKKINVEIEKKLARATGRIDSSLYETGISSGMPVGVLADLISAYSYDVDFQREIQPGDNIDVLFERLQTKNGVTAGHGDVLFAELNLSGKSLKIFRFVDKFGVADYYNEKGESIRKALLRTPINGAKITSAFGMRNHPILGYSKMHRGIDFGAPTGTPIYAAGDGTVEFVGTKGGYGNYLRIRHTTQYESAYAHISRFAAGIAPGHKVKQGQIVAYVGSTGMATGPHLHYEIIANNEQVNPSSVKFKTGNILDGKELLAFRKNMDKIQAQLAITPHKTDLAMADTARQSN